jgi:hypothetical protein
LWRLSKVSKNPKVGTSLSRSTILPEVYALFALDRNPEPRGKVIRFCVLQHRKRASGSVPKGLHARFHFQSARHQHFGYS